MCDAECYWLAFGRAKAGLPALQHGVWFRRDGRRSRLVVAALDVCPCVYPYTGLSHPLLERIAMLFLVLLRGGPAVRKGRSG